MNPLNFDSIKDFTSLHRFLDGAKLQEGSLGGIKVKTTEGQTVTRNQVAKKIITLAKEKAIYKQNPEDYEAALKTIKKFEELDSEKVKTTPFKNFLTSVRRFFGNLGTNRKSDIEKLKNDQLSGINIENKIKELVDARETARAAEENKAHTEHTVESERVRLETLSDKQSILDDSFVQDKLLTDIVNISDQIINETVKDERYNKNDLIHNETNPMKKLAATVLEDIRFEAEWGSVYLAGDESRKTSFASYSNKLQEYKNQPDKFKVLVRQFCDLGPSFTRSHKVSISDRFNFLDKIEWPSPELKNELLPKLVAFMLKQECAIDRTGVQAPLGYIFGKAPKENPEINNLFGEGVRQWLNSYPEVKNINLIFSDTSIKPENVLPLLNIIKELNLESTNS